MVFVLDEYLTEKYFLLRQQSKGPESDEILVSELKDWQTPNWQELHFY
jgi:hypothetical protein